MASKPPVAVYDACVLYPFHLRNVLIQCAFDGLVDARWTDAIHDEWMRNLAANTPAFPIERLIATRDRMKAVLPDERLCGAEIATASAMTCRSPAEMFSYYHAKLAKCLEPNVPYKPMDRCWRNAAPARSRGSTFKRRHSRSFQNLPCDPLETDGKYQLPAGDQALQFLQC